MNDQQINYSDSDDNIQKESDNKFLSQKENSGKTLKAFRRNHTSTFEQFKNNQTIKEAKLKKREGITDDFPKNSVLYDSNYLKSMKKPLYEMKNKFM